MTTDKKIPFRFVLEELEPIRPTVKRAFGFAYVYLDGKLLCGLRDSPKLPSCNGLWLFTTTEHVDSLGREFPELPRRYLWRSGKKAGDSGLTSGVFRRVRFQSLRADAEWRPQGRKS